MGIFLKGFMLHFKKISGETKNCFVLIKFEYYNIDHNNFD